MIKRISLLITAALVAATMMVATAPALFASPGSEACLSQNDSDTTATYGKDPDGGGFECTVTSTQPVSPSGKDNNGAKPFTDTTTDSETTSGQGGGGGQQTNPKHDDPPADTSVKNGGGNEPGGHNK